MFKSSFTIPKLQKAHPLDEKTYIRGEQDHIDLLSYDGLEEKPSYMKIGETYIRTLFISGYPYVATSGWLDMLIHFPHAIDISYHIEPIDSRTALPKLTRKITELESTKRTMIKMGKVLSSEILDPLDSAVMLKDNILRGSEKLFQVSIYMTISAESLFALEQKTLLLETQMAEKLFCIKIARYQQLEGYNAVLPKCENTLQEKRNLDSSSTSLTFPFVSSELVHESGILYGINMSNNSLVFLDRFLLTNANSIIFAQSGSGKSYTAKVEILRQLLQQTSVIVIDPEGEYEQLAKTVSGEFISLSLNAHEKINPFAFSKSGNFYEHVQDLTEILLLLFGEVSVHEKAIIDKAILETYETFFKNEKHKNSTTFPILKDFYKILKKFKQVTLYQRLEPYITGSLAQVFSSQTTITTTNRCTIFSLKSIPQTTKHIMMALITQFVSQQVYSHPKKRLLVIDEAWMLLEHTQTASFLAGLTRRARKHYLGVTMISQQAKDFLQNGYGRVIASQSALRILLKQDTTSIQYICDQFKLSTFEKQFLLTAGKGEALFVADENHVAVKIITSEKEHNLFTTDPKDLYH